MLVPAVCALSPFVFIAPAEKPTGFSTWQFVPFWTLFRDMNSGAFGSVFEAALHYVPMGYVLVALGRHPAVAFGCAFAFAEVLEILQIGIAGRSFDITEGVYAGVGALTGAWALERLRERGEPASPARP